jgi:cleavage and polyadenylation specificity factor subunit 3
MLDCGIHPGYSGHDGLPFFDRIECSSVELLLITHFHLDHAAALPYFTERTGFSGRIFCTHPTKAVLKLLLTDYIRLMDSADTPEADRLYTMPELTACLAKIELIDYHEQKVVGNVKFRAINAGHVLGACMFIIEIHSRTILYTGDYSMEEDRHLAAAKVPAGVNVDVLIVESTYGVQKHPTKLEREFRLTSTVDRIVSRGGKCLIPVFALGRAQELLMILEEYWTDNAHLHNIPVFYASKLASKALRVYQTYVNMCNEAVRRKMDVKNPFAFKYVKNLKDAGALMEGGNSSGPCVVFASPGMLQSGVSRRLFDDWCTDSKNGVIIAGYAVENTLAKDLQKGIESVTSMKGKVQPINMLVETISFSAHVDFVQNRDFIVQVDARHIVFVHGAPNEMKRLVNAMGGVFSKYNEDKRPTLATPGNTKPVKLTFQERREAKVLGKLANIAVDREASRNADVTMLDDGAGDNNHDEEEYDAETTTAGSSGGVREGDVIKGVLFTHNFQTRVCAPEDLPQYTQLRVGSIASVLHVPFVGSVDTLRLFLGEMFAGVNEYDEGDGVVTFGLHSDNVKVVSGKSDNMVTLSWEASPVNDMLADACVALIMHAQSSSASIRISS